MPATEPLYQHDAYLASVTARVVAAHPDGVVLDRSVLYPGGGGQPPDQGTLTFEGVELRVAGVAKRDGEAVALLEAPDPATPVTPPPAGAEVRVAVDWERRYALMRTHTALHVLGGVVARDHGARITGGNMDALSARMDFELPAMSADFAREVEEALRAEVAADRPVRISFLTPEEFASRPDLIRTKTNLVPPGLERIRVVDIEGLDRQADGGTHVRSTAEVGAVHVVGHQSKGKANKRLRIALDPAPAPAPRHG